MRFVVDKKLGKMGERLKILYSRYSTHLFRLGVLATCGLPIVAYLTYIGIFLDFETLAIVVLSIIFSFSTATYFKKVSDDLPETTQDTNIADFDVNEFIFQTDVTWIPRLYLVSHEGERQFVVEPSGSKPMIRFLSGFSYLSSGNFFPITYDVLTLD